MYHSLANDMVRQATERLNTDDIVISKLRQVSHLSGQQPSFAHLTTKAQHFTPGIDSEFKRYRSNESRILSDCVEGNVFKFSDI